MFLLEGMDWIPDVEGGRCRVLPGRKTGGGGFGGRGIGVPGVLCLDVVRDCCGGGLVEAALGGGEAWRGQGGVLGALACCDFRARGSQRGPFLGCRGKGQYQSLGGWLWGTACLGFSACSLHATQFVHRELLLVGDVSWPYWILETATG